MIKPEDWISALFYYSILIGSGLSDLGPGDWPFPVRCERCIAFDRAIGYTRRWRPRFRYPGENGPSTFSERRLNPQPSGGFQKLDRTGNYGRQHGHRQSLNEMQGLCPEPGHAADTSKGGNRRSHRTCVRPADLGSSLWNSVCCRFRRQIVGFAPWRADFVRNSGCRNTHIQCEGL